jgi:regulatory protein
MKIVVAADPSCRDSHVLMIDDEVLRSLPTAFFGTKACSFQACTRDELEEELATIEYKGVKRYVLRRLAAKSYYSEELKRLLLRKGASLSIIESVIAECHASGFLNDTEWIEAYIRRLQREKKGGSFITMKLQQMGVSKAEIAPFQSFLRDDEAGGIARLLATRYRTRNLQDAKERQKVIAALLRKGFAMPNIIKHIKALH